MNSERGLILFYVCGWEGYYVSLLRGHYVLLLALESDQRVEEMRRTLCDELPDDNYYILKYIINFLTEVKENIVK